MPFTPLSGAIGGTLIGGSAGVLLLLNGDIMGVSGILSNTLANPQELMKKNPKNHWRWVFLGSFGIAANVYVNFLNSGNVLNLHSDDNDEPIPSLLAHVVSGLLVGIGTKIGNGCTTGHGICGLGRLSERSLAAVTTFTGFSMLTRFFTSSLRPWSAVTEILRKQTLPMISPLGGAIVASTLVLPAMTVSDGFSSADAAKNSGAALSGALFAVGLAISGMTEQPKVTSFLCLSNLTRSGRFDPTLSVVLISAIGVSWLSYQFVNITHGISSVPSTTKLNCPVNLPKGSKFGIPQNKVIDARLLIGSSIFGIGWGLTGICPGPGLFAAAVGVIDVIAGWLPGFLAGSYIGTKIVERVSN